MNTNVKSTYKSNDTEEWLDRVFTRPIGYLWARLFARLGVHPNIVTTLSMIIGVASAFFFAHGSYRTEGVNGLICNIIGVLLLAWANFLDSADGQLARITDQKTLLGRILDGIASEVWFISIYCALVWRFWQHHALEFSWMGIHDTPENAIMMTIILFAFALYSGFHCHAGQCALADYYRQIHLLMVNGKAGSELDHSSRLRLIYQTIPWKGHYLYKVFLRNYIRYTSQQERRTPSFQALRLRARQAYGSIENVPQDFRDLFRAYSLPLMPLTNILTFNTRAVMLYVCCLIDFPWFYFLFEIVMMSVLCEYMRRKHEQFCKKLCITISSTDIHRNKRMRLIGTPSFLIKNTD